jgi:acyl CoA:acetate/3-ketoacid CoA transferase beta subunit
MMRVMLGTELYEEADGRVRPRGDYLKRFFTNRDGKKCLLYILANMGYFSAQRTDEARIVRNAAVALLEDIREQTGLGLDVNFVR